MDNASTIEKQLLSLIYTFLSEMDAQRALSRITINASIEKDLGIDSLGRVELLHRIEDSFSIHLSEKTLGEAETIQDLVQAILSANPPKKTSNHQVNSVLTKINIDVTKEKSLVSVLKKYAQTDPDRPHIYLQDEHGNEKVITYGLLFSMSESIADKKGQRKPWIASFTVITVFMSALLWFIKPAPDYISLMLFLIVTSTVAIEIATIFYNAMLRDISPPPILGRISGLAWGMGYLGG